jgi:hypothetical protein
MKRYVNENKYELGNIVNGKKKPVYKLEDFLISQLDEQFLSSELFEKISELWENENIPEEEIKEIYEKESYKINKATYDRAFHELTEMRKKKSTKSKSKRPLSKKSGEKLQSFYGVKTNVGKKAKSMLTSIYREKKTTTKPKRKIVKK